MLTSLTLRPNFNMKGWNSYKFNTKLRPEWVCYRFVLLLCLFFLVSTTTVIGQGNLELNDRTYDDRIKTVQLYQEGPQPKAQTGGPVVPLVGRARLLLEFDELTSDAVYYQAKIIHCNADWSQSNLSTLQYIEDYNEFNVDEYEYSFNTITPYVHYQFYVPRVKLPGNYVVVIYSEGNEEDIKLSRRFMVYESKVRFTDKYKLSKGAPYSRNNQQLAFEVNYEGVDIVNPDRSVTLHITQNQRWDNAKIDLRPTFVKEGQKVIEYRHFTEVNTFSAGNEFRFFDIRSLKYFGQKVSAVKIEKDEIITWVEPDKSQQGLAYSLEQDINGKFFIENLERKVATIENNYSKVYFNLKTPQIKGKIYVAGTLSDWQYTNKNALTWDKQSSSYIGMIMLKEGFYNYQYVVKSSDYEPNYFEGDFSETENLYEIFFYYRPIDLQADLLIGYLNLDFNQRP